MTHVAINGFGRIGRAFFKLAHARDDIHIVAINDLADPETLAYLLQYDSVYGQFPESISIQEGMLVVGDTQIPLHSEPKPEKLPWGDYDVDVVVEATGVFASYEKSQAHLTAGAKRVVISAPVSDDAPAGMSAGTVLMGVNDELLQTCDISSNASCTTNAGSPLMAILNTEIGVEKAMLNTVHGYTASQDLIDSPNEKQRRGRAAAINIVPTSTGAAIATTKAITELAGKFDGVAIRVPVAVGSLVDVTFVAAKETTVEEVNAALSQAAADPKWQGVFTTTDAPIVSSDIIGNTHASIADLSFTRVVDGNLVKVMAWYDNEMGYSHTLVDHVMKSAEFNKSL